MIYNEESKFSNPYNAIFGFGSKLGQNLNWGISNSKDNVISYGLIYRPTNFFSFGYTEKIFDDDNLNRDLIKEFLPEVGVVDLPDDPSLFVNTLINLDAFDLLSITDEDKNKGKMYLEEKEQSY